jgi:hypothetical protein
MNYFIGLFILSIAVGHHFEQFYGWMLFGTGILVAGIWNEVFKRMKER